MRGDSGTHHPRGAGVIGCLPQIAIAKGVTRRFVSVEELRDKPQSDLRYRRQMSSSRS